MGYIEGQDRQQRMLLPDSIEDLIGEDNPVRVMDAFVDGLDMSRLDFTQSRPAETGRPPYNPRDLLKLYIYGYFNKIRSSRKLMKECHRNIELFYLLNRLEPDFRTISDFRKHNSKALKGVFREFVGICLKLDLYKKDLFAIDGSKFRAVNSKDNAYNKDILQKKLARIEENIRNYLEEMDQNDHMESDEKEFSKSQIQEKIKKLQERKETYLQYQDQLKETGETQLLTTDPEARVMQSKDGFHCCYNVQTAVDKGSHLIAEYEVTNHCTDQGLLKSVADQTRETLNMETIVLVADKGYESRQDIENCILSGIVPNVAMKYDKEERVHTIPYIENRITEEERCSKKQEDIRKCLSAGVLPECYENTGIGVEVQTQGKYSCFIRKNRNTVICPMGKELHKAKRKGKNSIYISKEACRECKNKCTHSDFKTVSFGSHTTVVPVRMFGECRTPVQQVPADAVISSYNHSLDRKKIITQKVQIRMKSDPAMMKERMCLSEHPFGTIKWYHGAHYLLCRGKEKATAEIGLSLLAYNMKRAMNMVGTKALIAAM